MRSHALSVLLLASLPLAACSPAAPPTLPAASATMPTRAAPRPAAVEPASNPAGPADATASSEGATIEGAIRDGNRPPPALRICAHPLGGGKPTCIDMAAGATDYRMALAPGRYVVVAQAVDDPGLRFAHASRVRCIRAPCPPDALVELALAPGEARSGIDLTAGPAEMPADAPAAD